MYSLLRSLLFLLPAETAHYFTMYMMRLLIPIPGFASLLRSLFFVERPVHILGIVFPNRIGLAAGFDKDARFVKEIECLGFGFIEVGTVTPLPQAGNEKPRLFRLPKDKALINRMGFNNRGVDAMVEELKKLGKTKAVIGCNIGKNKTTPAEDAANDYLICFDKLYSYASYFVVNVSSPNTPGLRALQDKESLQKILSVLIDCRKMKISGGEMNKPILLKIAPDLSMEQLDEVVEVVEKSGIEGIIASNTTISRKGLLTNQKLIEQIGAGGLSGKPLKSLSDEVLKYLKTKTNLPIIASGGILEVADAQDKLNAGVQLVQVYTGFIYSGPALIKKVAAIN